MLKFRCQHCGQRIAVPSRHLGRLVTCSECGAQTHPLAEQIVAAGPSGVVAPAPTAVAPVRASTAGACDNCGLPIGRLQATLMWNEHVVCGVCYHRLSGESGTAVLSPAPAATAVVARARVAATEAADPPVRPLGLEMRERVLRALVIFVVASVALYGALSLLRDIAGLIAVAAVAVLALLSLYALFRGSIAARRKLARTTELAPLRRGAA